MNNQPYSPDPRVPGYEQPTVPNYPPNYRDNMGSPYGAGAHAQGQQNYTDPAGNSMGPRFEDKNLERANSRYWIRSVTYFLLGVLEIILLLRFIFRLLGANQGNGLIVFLYNLSNVFVSPFNGIFNDQTIGNVSVFEVSTLLAMLLYALIAWGIVSLGKVMFAPSVPGR